MSPSIAGNQVIFCEAGFTFGECAGMRRKQPYGDISKNLTGR
jgi:hypothetical protein